MKAPFQPGQRVKWSEYALRGPRSNWLSAGYEPAKSLAKERLDHMKAVRGIVIDCKPGNYTAWVVDVMCEGESGVHQSMSHLWEESV